MNLPDGVCRRSDSNSSNVTRNTLPYLLVLQECATPYFNCLGNLRKRRMMVVRRQRNLGLIVVLLLARSLLAPLSANANASSAPEARIYGPQEVYVGTDATFLI